MFFGIFGKKEKYDLGGRQIEIVNDSKASDNLLDITRKAILSACEMDVAKRFSVIRFYLVKSAPKGNISSNFYAWVKFSETAKGKYNV